MSLKDYVSDILPHFERSRIIEDIDSLSSDLTDNLLPSYAAAVPLFRGGKFVSKPGKDAEAFFHLRNRGEGNTTHFQYIDGCLRNLPATLQMLEKLVPELFSRDVTKDSLTYKKAAVLQLLGVTRFVLDYAGRHLLRVAAAEEATMRDQPIDTQCVPADLKFLDEGRESFFAALKIIGQPAKDIAAKLGQMQDLSLVVGQIDVATSTHGPDSVDPFRLAFMGRSCVNSPIYMVRSMIANYQVANHKARIEERKVLQLRLFAMKDAQNGKNDVKLQETIKYHDGRLQRLNEEIASFEERYAN